jgi:ferric-dicitrate binding protein FerR (iron transport regulator)
VDLANGARLHTTVSPTDIQLENGVVIRLATRSTTMLFGDRLILDNGALRMNHFDGYPVQAGGLTIRAEGFDTEAIVRATPKTIEVAALGGAVRVSDPGSAMTLVAPGTKMAFQNSGAAAGGQNPQTPTQTGAAPAQTQPQNGPLSDKKAILWAAGICAVGAIVVGSIAAAEGKSPF